MHKRYLTLAACAASSVAALTQAQGFKPAPVKLGFVDLVPVLTVREEYDGNLYREAENEEEAWIQVMILDMKARALDGPHEYALDYRGEAGFVDESSEDNYVDQSTRLGGKWDFSTRHRFELAGSYRQDHDRRGTEYFQGDEALLIDEPARYREEMILSRYSYGAKSARGRLDFEVSGLNKSYENFRELTERNDLSKVDGTATFLWRVAGNLRGLLETTHGQVDYDTDPQEGVDGDDTRDSDYASYLTGVTWELAGKTTGTLKAGYATKDFSDDDRTDFSGASWSGDLGWSPRSYSTFTLSAGRRTDESNGRGDYIDATDWGISWAHQWGDRIETRLRYRYSDETYEADPSERDDDIHRYGFNIDYTLQRWLVVGLFYTRDQRESNIAQYDYPRDYAGLVLRASL